MFVLLIASEIGGWKCVRLLGWKSYPKALRTHILRLLGPKTILSLRLRMTMKSESDIGKHFSEQGQIVSKAPSRTATSRRQVTHWGGCGLSSFLSIHSCSYWECAMRRTMVTAGYVMSRMLPAAERTFSRDLVCSSLASLLFLTAIFISESVPVPVPLLFRWLLKWLQRFVLQLQWHQHCRKPAACTYLHSYRWMRSFA